MAGTALCPCRAKADVSSSALFADRCQWFLSNLVPLKDRREHGSSIVRAVAGTIRAIESISVLGWSIRHGQSDREFEDRKDDRRQRDS
jgi:hypothetical protein